MIQRKLILSVKIRCCRSGEGVVYETVPKEIVIQTKPVKWTRINLVRWGDKQRDRIDDVLKRIEQNAKNRCKDISPSLDLCKKLVSSINVISEEVK